MLSQFARRCTVEENVTDTIAQLWRLTPEERARVLSRLRSRGEVEISPTVEPQLVRRTDRSDPVLASFAQEQLWFLEQLAPQVPYYNVPFSFSIEGPLDPAALAAVLSEIARRHEILRTTFEQRAQGLVQVVHEHMRIDFATVDVSASPDPYAEARRLEAELVRSRFRLSRPPLWRVELIQLDHGRRRHLLVWVSSHVVADGWSIGVLTREMQALYGPLRYGREGNLPDPPIQFRDYAVWQRQRLAGARLDRLVDHWRRRLDGCPVLAFPADRPRPLVPSFLGRTHQFLVSPDLAQRIGALGHDLGATQFMTYLAAYQALLARWCGQTDVAVGTPVSGRLRPELESSIGCFVNTVVIRSDLSGDPSFGDVVACVRERCLDAYDHDELPFGKLVEALRPPRDGSFNPLCQTVFSLGSIPSSSPRLELTAGTWMQFAVVPNDTVRFDLELSLDPTADGLVGRFDYSVDLLLPESAAQLCDCYLALLAAVAANPSLPLSWLPAPLPHGREHGPKVGAAAAPDVAGEAPWTETQRILARLWAEALDLDEIGPNDDFFALGGHSLLAAKLLERTRDLCRVDLGLADFFLGPCTVAGLAATIDERRDPTVGGHQFDEATVELVERLSDEEIAALLAEPAPEPGARTPGPEAAE